MLAGSKRVVVTGMGIVSSLGRNQQEVLTSLMEAKSGIGRNEGHVEMGLRSQVSGLIEVDLESLIDRKMLRFMGEASAWSYLAFQEAISQAGLSESQISNDRVGVVMGAGGASTANVVESVDLLREKGIRKVGPYRVTRTMNSAINANLSTPFKIRGLNYSITSACATSAHCIGVAAQQIQFGMQDMMFAGGGEDIHWSLSCLFDAMGALSSGYNETPERASRPFDQRRDGFVISGGAGVLVLESLDHALSRGAKILAELTGFGATSDGVDMVAPSGEGAVRCMNQALATARRKIDYLNAHGTSTQAGDMAELGAIEQVFSENCPVISSTKSLSGHALGAAGVHEAIYSLLMMQNGFIAPSANIDVLDEKALGCNIALEPQYDKPLQAVLSNSFGFGGTNASLVFEQYE